MDAIIRKATLNDLKDIQKLNLMLCKKEYDEYDKLLNLNWVVGYDGKKYFQDRISEDYGCIFVAVVNGNIIGYLAGSLTKAEEYRNMPITAELNNTFVLDEFRSMGVGTSLYKKFIEWCKEKKVKRTRVQASAQNIRAIKFYRQKGFNDYTLILETDI
jgi:ribosomal protein S18 acetylase RimI-like enzyme